MNFCTAAACVTVTITITLMAGCATEPLPPNPYGPSAQESARLDKEREEAIAKAKADNAEMDARVKRQNAEMLADVVNGRMEIKVVQIVDKKNMLCHIETGPYSSDTEVVWFTGYPAGFYDFLVDGSDFSVKGEMDGVKTYESPLGKRTVHILRYRP